AYTDALRDAAHRPPDELDRVRDQLVRRRVGPHHYGPFCVDVRRVGHDEPVWDERVRVGDDALHRA
ncbi:hypothetical protein, partial [Gordonia sp. VNK21]|uniref:hypothetical protein n=1 Tax=Gordonia sp. VNK21 TaxID=3382483 RepID=UPI0038D4D31B